MNAHLVLAVLAVLAARVGFLYLAPFGPCPKCKGTGHIKRGPRRRPVCPRCKGRRASSAPAPAPSTGSPAGSATGGRPPPGTSREDELTWDT